MDLIKLLRRTKVTGGGTRYCQDCKWWGNEWIKDLSRKCSHPDNQSPGEIFITAMLHSCSHWERR